MSSVFNTLQPHLLFKKLISEFELQSELVKFSDDTALLSLMSNDEVGHGPVLNHLVEWCEKLYLCRDATNTKDMCIDSRKYPPSQSDTVIHDNQVEVVDEYKYLDTTIDNKLKWDCHYSVTYKKCQQRLYCLRKRCSFIVDSTIMSLFNKS